MGEAYEVARAPDHEYARSARRITYLIDPEGVIRGAYEVKDIEMHPAKVLADLRGILGITV